MYLVGDLGVFIVYVFICSLFGVGKLGIFLWEFLGGLVVFSGDMGVCIGLFRRGGVGVGVGEGIFGFLVLFSVLGLFS